MKMLLYRIFLGMMVLFTINACQNTVPASKIIKKTTVAPGPEIVRTEKAGAVNDLLIVVGHRGARGLLPENTIPAFLKGIELGADCIEMDVYLTKDHQVVVSHDPRLSYLFTTNPDGTPVTAEQTDSLIIYNMTYAELEKYDVGIRTNPNFPMQKSMATKIPLLTDVFDSVENHYRNSPEVKKRVVYIVEFKSDNMWDNVYHPEVPAYVDSVMKLIKDVIPPERLIIHSFDPRALNYMHMHYPEYSMEYLRRWKGIKINMDSLNFIPQMYGPDYNTISKTDVDSLHQLGMLVDPWTIDTLATMEYVIDTLGVDGLTSDYPNITVPKYGDPNRSLNAKTMEFEYWTEKK